MNFAQIAGTGVLFSAVISILVSAQPATAQPGCDAAAMAARDAALKYGARIDYGDSLQEVALYRWLTGIDPLPLKDDFQRLTWGGPDGYEARYDFDAEERSAPFSDLLIAAAAIESDPAAYIRYYGAQDMLKQSGLRAYRPERGTLENSADWWLQDDADPIYREDDFAGWLQAMAASDTFHRIYRSAGRAYYRSLISSWTYFDPKKWDVVSYDRVTALALDKWQREGRFIWSAVAFSRLRTDQVEADGLIDWFYNLHEGLKSCVASRDEAVLYPLFRFHTLRLLFMRAAYMEDQSAYEKAMALMADTIPSLASGFITSDDTAAWRAALLMAGYEEYRQVIYPTTGAILEDRIPHAKPWRDLRWASARSFEDYVKLAVGQDAEGAEIEILNGLSTESIYELLENGAFNQGLRDKLAETGWLRTYLLDQVELNQQFLAYIAETHTTLQDEAKTLLAVNKADLAKENLLFILRHPDFSVLVDTDINQRFLWCNGIGWDAYQATLGDIMGPVLRMAEVPKIERWIHINYWEEYDRYSRSVGSPAFAGAAATERWQEWLGTGHWFDPKRNKAPVSYDELTRLARLPLPRDLLIGRVLDWAKAERNSFEQIQAFFDWNGDQRVAEALHFAVRNTRKTCAGDPHRLSRAAWIVLHSNPRWQVWADKTPYWYD